MAAPSFSLETIRLCCCWCHETSPLPFKVLGHPILWRITPEDAPQNLTFLWRTQARMRHQIFLRPLTCGPSLRRPLSFPKFAIHRTVPRAREPPLAAAPPPPPRAAPLDAGVPCPPNRRPLLRPRRPQRTGRARRRSLLDARGRRRPRRPRPEETSTPPRPRHRLPRLPPSPPRSGACSSSPSPSPPHMHIRCL